MTIQTVLKTIARGIEKESPTILTGLGITGIATTAIMAVKATPKALWLLEQEEERRYKEKTWPLLITKIDTVKITWKCYLPAALVGLATAACFIGAHSINIRRNAALASLYSITEASLKTYQEKVVEVIGKNKEEKIREEIAQDIIDKHPLSNEKQIIITGKGEVLFFDTFSGRYFKSDIETVRRIQNDINANILGGDDYAIVNHLYDDLGIGRIKAGETVGWVSEDKHLLDMSFTTRLAGDGQPCIVMDYSVYPVF